MNAFCLPTTTLKRLIYIGLLIVTLFSSPSNQQQQQQQQYNEEAKESHYDHAADSKFDFIATARKLLLEGNAADVIARSADNMIKSVPYFQSTIPMRIFECIRDFSVLRCTKLFVLQKLEERKSFPNSGNMTKDFLDQFFGDEERMGSLISGKLAGITDKELNQRLVWNFQRFFKDRDIKLHFLPGMMVKIVPSKENKLKFSLKKKTKPRSLDLTEARLSKQDDGAEENISIGDSSEPDADTKGGHGGGGGGGGGGGAVGGAVNKRKHKKNSSYKYTILQMAVPVMIMPAILMGSILPFLLPVLKMATFMSMMLNNSAFIAALIYAARTHANSQEEPQHINYGPPQGYH